MIEQSWFENLPVKIVGRNVICFKKATSTNDLAWLEISRGAPEGTVIFADEQLKGRGRFGRTWYAPQNAGIWASIVLKPQIAIEKSSLLMVIGAIAICELIKDKFRLAASIRWPNDVLIKTKKVAGIIVETKCIANKPEAMVLGIGFNVNLKREEIPDELKTSITSLYTETGDFVNSKDISRQLLIYLDKWYDKVVIQSETEICNAWRELSGVMGNTVLIESEGQIFEGTVIGLDPCKGILLKLPAGEKLFRGECVTSLCLK